MILRNKLSNKKAQIGMTFSWFVAFLVILVIMVIYLISVVMISAKKEVSSSQLSSEDTSMDLKSLESERKIEYLLNAPITISEDKNIQIKDLIELWIQDEDAYEDLLESSIKNTLDSLEYNNYNEYRSRWEINVNSLSILKKETSSPEKAISIDATKYSGMNVVGVTSQKFYFSLSTGESVELTLTTGNTPWTYHN